jgi:hypothetical protein
MPSRHAARLLAFLTLLSLSAALAARAADDKVAVVARMTADLTFLASDECEGRGPGTAGIDKAADHIAAAFRAAGLKGAMPDGSYFQPFTIRTSPRPDEERQEFPAKNIVGVLPGAGPLANETIVIGAHYDHLGYGSSNSLAPGVKAIHHGADDNASGTAAVIELARRFAAIPNRQGRRLVFITFSGEEIALLGSAHYVNNPLFPLENTVAMLNLDMVGRLNNDPDSGKGKLEVGGTGSAKEFDALIDKVNGKYGFDLKKSKSGVGPSDHTSFYMKGVPVYFFFTGTHAQYHKPTDTVDLINFAGMAKITDMVEELAQNLSIEPTRPEYVKVASSSMGTVRGNIPRLGITPGDYADDAEGVLIGMVAKDGPAEKGGLKDGDVIVAIAGKPIKNMSAYMAVLADQKRGEAVEITVVRKGERVTLKVTPQ